MSKLFKAPGWMAHTNVYEVNLRQYTPEGTLKAFEKEFPRLRDMGVETLWFMPVTPIAEKNKKGTMGSYYACSDYTSVAAEFGTVDDFRVLVQKAHESGFKVILDWVANHTGWDHIWTKEHPEWFEMDPVTNDFRMASGMEDIIELDFTNKELRRAMIDAMKFWVTECDIDGFRADLAFWVEADFWLEARPELDAVKPLFWLGEFDELEAPAYTDSFDACYSWSWMQRSRDFYQNKWSMESLEEILNRYRQAADSGSVQIYFTTNHDENSWNGTEYEKYGNMARALAVFSCTWSGIPLIYSGQEMPNYKRLAFFDKDAIEWTGTYELHDFYKTLLALHTGHPAMAAGDKDTLPNKIVTTAYGQIYAYSRKKGEREVLVFLNFSSTDELTFGIPNGQVNGIFRELFSGENMEFSDDHVLSIPAWGYRVFVK